MNSETKAYKDRMTSAVFGAIVEASMTETDGVRTAAVLSGEVSDVLLSTMALLMSGSEECSTPGRTRKLCDDFARKLQRRITTVRAANTDFIQHVHLGAAQ